MTLWKATYKDIFTTLSMVLGHWLHRRFVQIKIEIFGKNKVRLQTLKTLKKREHHLIVAFQRSIDSMQEYQALVKGGYDPTVLPEI